MKDDDDKYFELFNMDLEKIKIGQVYPIFGLITHILEDSDTSFVAVLNYNIRAKFNRLTPEFRKIVRDRLLETGIFVSKIVAINPNHTLDSDLNYNDKTIFQIEVSVEKVILNSQRKGPDGTIIKEEAGYLSGNKKVPFNFSSKEEQIDFISNMAPELRNSLLDAPSEKIINDLNQSTNLIEKLGASFVELREVIIQTKEILIKKPQISQDILNRIDSYFEIVDKQEALLPGLRASIENKDGNSLMLYIQKINRLSEFIREDAKHILSGKALSTHEDDLQ